MVFSPSRELVLADASPDMSNAIPGENVSRPFEGAAKLNAVLDGRVVKMVLI
jgi:hypothetical protein